MFAVTYLGQQGWLLCSRRTRVLVDPLLTEEYSPGFEAIVYPPRDVRPRALPAIDAVFLSHEHADHLNVPSLAMLDRRIPIVMPALAAAPLRDVVAALGFRVVLAEPWATYSCGDLLVRTAGGVHARDAELESEWTTLQLAISDREGHGSFFSYVDSWPSEQGLRWLERTVGRVGYLCHANNTMDWSCLEQAAAPWPRDAFDYAAELVAAEASWWRQREAPTVTAVCGPGLAFVGDDSWMNQILCVDSERVCAALRALSADRTFIAPLPGDTTHLVAGRPRRGPPAPFVRRWPRKRWPIVGGERRPISDGFGPACGQRSLHAASRAGLEALLAELASYLYRRALFRELLSSEQRAPRGVRRKFALVLRDEVDGQPRPMIFEYDPAACRFVRSGHRDPQKTAIAGVECWASDLRGVLVGELLPQRLLGHLRTWSHTPQIPSPLQAIWGFFDFVHRPKAAAAFYAPLVARASGCPPIIAAGRSAATLRRERG